MEYIEFSVDSKLPISKRNENYEYSPGGGSSLVFNLIYFIVMTSIL